MGLLDEPGLDRLVAAGCPKCGAHELTFRTYVDGLLPLLGGEPTGRMTWVYDGEKFVDGVYEIVWAACPGCDGEEVRYIAFVPARVAYQGKRAEKARSSTELHEPGFHGARVDCRDCGTVAELTDRCPLCDAPGPLRARPG